METSFSDRKLHHYFMGCVSGVSKAHQMSETELVLEFPGVAYIVVGFDHRQRGVLAAFDGTLLWGSLPRRNKSLLYHKYMYELEVPAGQLRKTLSEEEKPEYEIFPQGTKRFARVRIYRSVVLLPFNYRTIVRRYDEKSMNPKYLVISTDTKSVTWLTTSS